MSSFEIQLSPEDVQFFGAIREQREREAQAWLKVRSALSEYISRHVDTSGENPSDIEELVSISLPDLVDEIVEDVRRGEA